MEHHSNIVPWQMVAAKNKCKLKFIGIDKDGKLDIHDFKSKLTSRTKLVSIVHVSNTLGCCNIHQFFLRLVLVFEWLQHGLNK